MIARTGYTGEDGFEIYIPSDEPTSTRVWGEVLAAGSEFGILPCGLGARNTLRLEAGMALYGHEISDTINVFEANLSRYAKLDPAAKSPASSAATPCSPFKRPAAPNASSSASKSSTAASAATATPSAPPPAPASARSPAAAHPHSSKRP
jgi:predicted lipid-binding transport protein (Tim44 family)